MEELIFKSSLERCKIVAEPMTCLEMYCYADSSLNYVDERLLESDELFGFLNRLGSFAPPPPHHDMLASIRMVLQKELKHRDAVAPNFISLKRSDYVQMVNTFHLPRRTIESSSAVGPFFDYSVEKDGDNTYLKTIFRKSDARIKGHSSGWEISLSHNILTSATTGYCKGTAKSDIPLCISMLKRCITEITHPMLLPLIIFSFDSSFYSDIRQLEARNRLNSIEGAIFTGTRPQEWALPTQHRPLMQEAKGGGVIDLDTINRALVECTNDVLWKRPASYLGILGAIGHAAEAYWDKLPKEQKIDSTEQLQERILARVGYYKRKWQGLETSTDTAMQRLEVLRSAFYAVTAQKDSKLNFAMAGEQMKVAHASKRDSIAMKGISLLGSVFLPGAYIASIFSTSFFDFKDAPTISSTVSPRFWIYWAVNIPVTALVAGLWYTWERNRMRRYEREEGELKRESGMMEERTIEEVERKYSAA